MPRLERALIIRRPYIDRILSGRKTWEIRNSNTQIRGIIGLIEARSGLIVGCCELVDVTGPPPAREWRTNARRSGASAKTLGPRPYRRTFVWVLKLARRFPRSRPYAHPCGAVGEGLNELLIWRPLQTSSV